MSSAEDDDERVELSTDERGRSGTRSARPRKGPDEEEKGVARGDERAAHQGLRVGTAASSAQRPVWEED